MSRYQQHILQGLKHHFDCLSFYRNLDTSDQIRVLVSGFQVSAEPETWRAAIRYARERSAALDAEIWQLRERAREVAFYTAQDLGLTLVYDARPTERLEGVGVRELMDMWISLVLERKRKRIEAESLIDAVIASGRSP